MGMTMAEKILARASRREQVAAGEYVTATVDVMMGHDSSILQAFELIEENGFTELHDPAKVVAVLDHRVPAPNVVAAERHRQIRDAVKQYGIEHFYEAGTGICHVVMPEKGHVLPGRLIVGGDSHTTTYGALGAASTGIGYSELAYALIKGELWFRVPETIQFVLQGELGKGVGAKDIQLRIAGQFGAEVAQYKAVEFTGPVAEAMEVEARMTMSNMGVEIGAKFAFFEADEKALAYLKGRTSERLSPFGPDADAAYLARHEVDVTGLEPQVAMPHNVDNVVPISEVGEVLVHQAFLGSCTNARTGDLERAAAILKGRTVSPWTRLVVIPGSHEIHTNLVRSGAIQTFLEAGAMIATPGCGACGGGHMGILAAGENAVTSTNRNFKGRMGSPESFVHLASPETVAASAIEGRISDPRKYLD
jgi:3-isopropylmalate/(R)-2-methylmalate dehydratase large subunit